MDDTTKTIEEWATVKGYLPMMLVVPARVGRIAAQTQRLNPQYLLFAQAKAHRQWPIGAEVTEEDFDDAVEEAGNLPLM